MSIIDKFQKVNVLNNLWISASAGSGKTKRLIERFLALLLSGAQVSSIVCITFTKAAAAEMHARIISELSSWMLCQEESLIKRLKELTGEQPTRERITFARSCFANFLNVQDNLHIETIHSLCQSILNKFPFESHINFVTKVIDDNQRDEFVEQAKALLIYDESLFNRTDVQRLFAQVHDLRIDELLKKILFIESMAPKLFDSIVKVEEYVHELAQKLNGHAQPDPAWYATEIRNLACLLPESAELTCLTAINSALSEQSPIAVLAKLYEITFTKTGNPRMALLNKKQKENRPDVCLFISRVQEMQMVYMRALAAYDCVQNTSGLLQLGYRFLAYYKKVKGGATDYADLIRYCLKLLQDLDYSQWIRCYLNGKFSHIMVDEAQDVNLEQWSLVRLLINEFFYNAYVDTHKTFFVVGDPKQAIYSFQGTSPYLFMGMERAFKMFAAQFDIEVVAESLNESFRSDSVILNFIDKVFEHIRKKNPSYFIEDTCHIARKKFKGSAIELWPVEFGAATIKEEALIDDNPQDSYSCWALPNFSITQKIHPARTLATKLAARIKDLIENFGYKQSDIMILVRKRDVFINYMLRALKSLGVATSGADRVALSKHIVVKDLISLAKFILFPHDDYNLACLLKSPICGVGEADLFKLCQRRDDQALWSRLKDEKDATPYAEFYILLDSVLTNSAVHSPYALFIHVLDVLKVRASFVARFGLYINDVLDEFLELCLNCEERHHRSLELFLKWFSSSGFEIKRDLGGHGIELADEVRIMTVHAAKGLQAKVVILPDTLAVLQQSRGNILFSQDTGEIMCAGLNSSLLDAYAQLTNRIKMQELQESYRLLYVALTRASERLLICGWSNKKFIPKDSWYAVLSHTYSA